MITFQGTTVEEIEQAFKNSIDNDLERCKERKKESEKAHSGKFNLRMPPNVYVEIAARAAQEGMSINSYILKRLTI